MTGISRFARPRSRLSVRFTALLHHPQFWFGLAMLVPWFIWYAIFLYRPIIQGFWWSFLKYDLLRPSESTFVGLKNFQNVFANARFWIALKNTFTYAVLTYALRIALALFISWFLVIVRRGQKLYQFIVFLPVVVSMVAISMLFKMLMDPQFGTLNQMLRALGLPTSQWIASSDTALISIILVDVWKGLGFSVILLMTAMLNVPETLYDAAKVDGATGWRLFRYLTLPLIAHTLAMVSVLQVIGGLQVYVSVAVLGPGPGTSTLVINQMIVTEAFQQWRFGFATATSLVMFAIILVLTVLQLRVFQPKWEY
ncbi:MAG: carbohydrate ABC transporter permease [Anaerolineae bacterium]